MSRKRVKLYLGADKAAGMICCIPDESLFSDSEAIYLLKESDPDDLEFLLDAIPLEIERIVAEIYNSITPVAVQKLRKIINLLWELDEKKAHEIAFASMEHYDEIERKQPWIRGFYLNGELLDTSEWNQEEPEESEKDRPKITVADFKNSKIVPLSRVSKQIPGSRRNRGSEHLPAPPAKKIFSRTSPFPKAMPSSNRTS